MLEDFRLLILQRLKERDNKCRIFERIFDAHSKIIKSLNHLLVMGLPDFSMAKNKQSLSQSKEFNKVTELKKELSDLYKQNAINNQRLIESNCKLADSEKQLSILLQNRDKALKELALITDNINSVNKDICEYKDSNELLKDECIAYETLFNGTNNKLLRAESERIEYKKRINQLTKRNKELINEINQLDKSP